jgi:hypothetical protein
MTLPFVIDAQMPSAICSGAADPLALTVGLALQMRWRAWILTWQLSEHATSVGLLA